MIIVPINAVNAPKRIKYLNFRENSLKAGVMCKQRRDTMESDMFYSSSEDR